MTVFFLEKMMQTANFLFFDIMGLKMVAKKGRIMIGLGRNSDRNDGR